MRKILTAAILSLLFLTNPVFAQSTTTDTLPNWISNIFATIAAEVTRAQNAENNAQTTANNAQTTATNAQTTANNAFPAASAGTAATKAFNVTGGVAGYDDPRFAAALQKSNNLSDVPSPIVALANLGGLSIANAASTYAPLNSPALVGNPTAPTQTTGDTSTKIATDGFVGNAIAAIPQSISSTDFRTGLIENAKYRPYIPMIGATADSFYDQSGVDILDSYTKLQMHFDSSVTADDAGHTVAISVGSPTINTTTPKFGAGAASFNGASYLTATPIGSDFNLTNTNIWTLEAWIYPTSATSVNEFLQSTSLQMYLNASGILTVDNRASANFSSTAAVTFNAWNKIEISCNVGACSYYLNGTFSNNFSLQATTGGPISIGGGAGGPYYFTGYMDELRISIGVARHTANYTVETAAFNPGTSTASYDSVNKVFTSFVDPFTKALFHFDTSTADSFGHTVVSGGTPTISSAQSKFGAGSLFTNGGAYLTVTPNNSDLTLSTTSIWTLEGWFYQTSFAASSNLFSSSALNLYIDTAGHLIINNASSGNFSSTLTVPLNTWYKIEFDCINGTGYAFINGTLAGTFTMQATSGGGAVYIGTYNNGSSDFLGYIDEVRISMGVARHTTSYTVETIPFSTYGSLDLRSLTFNTSYTPTKGSIFMIVNPIFGTITPNTNLISSLSQNATSGTPTYTNTPLTLSGTTTAGFPIYEANNVTLPGIGTNPKWRIQSNDPTLALQVRGVYFQEK